MLGALIGGGVSALTGIISGAVAKKQHNKYADILNKQTFEIPESVGTANDIMANLSTQGIVGMDRIAEKTRSSLPSSVSAYKDIVDNPMALLGATQTAEQNVNDKLAEFYIGDAAAKAENMRKYAGFQSDVVAGWEGKKDEFEREKALAIQREKMAGTKELLQGVTGGLQTGFSTFAGLQQNKYMGDYYKKLMGAYGNSDIPATSEPALLKENPNGIF